MACSSLLIRLFLVIAPAVASDPRVVRRAAIDAKGRVGSKKRVSLQSKTQLGLSFWQQLRQDLEKKEELAADGARENGRVSAAARRDLLWNAVREVDDQLHQKYICSINDGITYAKEPSLVQGGQSTYTKADITSARVCALMCAADPLGERSGHSKPCKSFTYNKTAMECKFFSFAQQAESSWVKDACCTSGPPCNLESMREEIQTRFEAQMKRTMSSQIQLAGQLKKANERLATTVADRTKKTKQLSLELRNTKQQSSELRKADNAKPTKPVLVAAAHPTHAEPLKPLSDRVSGGPAATQGTTQRSHWHRCLNIGLAGLVMTLAAALSWRFRGYLVKPPPKKFCQNTNDHLIASPQRAAAQARWASSY